MPIESTLVLAAISFVFAIFAAALAWGEHCTRTRSPDSTPAE
jgi:hypothetical protein